MTNRKSATAMTAAEQTRYRNAITTMLATPTNPYGKMVAIHGDMRHNMHGMHIPGMPPDVGTQRFLPWHRDYLLKFERMLQAIDPLCFIPYFDWTAGTAVPTWIRNFKPTVNVPGQGPVIVKRNASIPARKNLINIMSQTTFTPFTDLLESGPHGEVHMELGVVNGRREAMARIAVSPADPIFWLHHAMIDKIWATWQTAHPGKNPTLTGPDAIMDPWPETATSLRSITTLAYAYV